MGGLKSDQDGYGILAGVFGVGSQKMKRWKEVRDEEGREPYAPNRCETLIL